MLTATQSKALDTVLTNYVIPDPDDVRAFLEERPRVAEVLVEALDLLPRYFDGRPAMTLLIRYDADGEQDPYVGAYIETTMPFMEAKKAIHQMSAGWLRTLPFEVREGFLFMPKYFEI